MNHVAMIAKVKALAIAFGFAVAAAGTTAALEFTGSIDWSGWGIFGPGIGSAVTAGLTWLVAYVKRSAPEDFQDGPPGGTPLP